MIYRTLKTTFQKILLFVITMYSNYLSYFLPSSCRFYPSCSHYSHDAIKEHGSMYGAYLTIRRILRCHPWHEGGFDPVPKRLSKTNKIGKQQSCCNKHNYPRTSTSTHI